MVGRLYPEFIGKFGAIVIFVGFPLTFGPQFIVGWLGMPRRYHAYPEEWQVLNVMSTAGASILGVGFLIAISSLIWSAFWGKKASADPWGAKGLEWEKCTSPPHPHNFTSIPVVTEEAYCYTGREDIDRRRH
jgi:cytochrome c oxidase subunit 1